MKRLVAVSSSTGAEFFARHTSRADSAAPKHAKVLSKPIHLRDLVNEVQKMLAVAA